MRIYSSVVTMPTLCHIIRSASSIEFIVLGANLGVGGWCNLHPQVPCSLDFTVHILHLLCSRYDPHTNQWSSDVAPTSSCRTSVGVAVLGDFLYAVGGQDGVSCLNYVERFAPFLAKA